MKPTPLSRFLLLALLLCVSCVSLSAAEKPNVIVIMADDLGYGDLSCYGADDFETPFLVSLSDEHSHFVRADVDAYEVLIRLGHDLKIPF